jgi:anti-sigma factor RsiW
MANHGCTDDAIWQGEARGYQILHWKGEEMTYWVMSDLNNAELLGLARALRGH